MLSVNSVSYLAETTKQAASIQSGHPRAAAEVPERPALAPNVQLIGEMQGTGFTDRQWLIQRDGRFIQISELLYRIAEQTDGERTLEEIAGWVTASTDWMVNADHVRQLIQAKLIPLGLVAAANGPITSPAGPAVESRGHSPLALNMRIKTLSPRLIDPITRILQVFYAPLILMPMLVAVTIAHGWLYRVNGIAESLREGLYTPGGLLFILAIVILGGIFHEFGHAAALRYGGGKVRGMGAGLYLLYPAFYTDVTDSYRLGRWARLRTDLGGVYFHLIFALGLITLSIASGKALFLFAVLLINLDVARQFIPFGRFDGYWALADLTGIPDFFSQMGPFLRSVLPIPGLKGSKLPDLKPWVKAVFAGYILLTIPVLTLFFVLMVWNFPRFMVIAWESWLYQSRAFSIAQNMRDFLGMAAVVSQMLLLTLSMLAAAYFLYIISRAFIGVLWNWGRPTLTRRIVAALATAGTVTLIAVLWAPEILLAGRLMPAGVLPFEVTERAHVQTPVVYAQIPPVGGDHAPIWQNCGFYDAPITNEHAVHSLEHGAVWITYHPDLPKKQIDILRQRARRQPYLLVSAFFDLPAPIVASAWGGQLRLDSPNDPRLDQFVRAFRLGPQAPERGGPCTGGVGVPSRD
jgi:putative peptide zinc metalloprotease protein